MTFLDGRLQAVDSGNEREGKGRSTDKPLTRRERRERRERERGGAERVRGDAAGEKNTKSSDTGQDSKRNAKSSKGRVCVVNENLGPLQRTRYKLARNCLNLSVFTEN